MQANESTYDKRAYPIARPTDCSKGAECKRFQTEFLQGAQAVEVEKITTTTRGGGGAPGAPRPARVLGLEPDTAAPGLL